ncbi:hypothetical protein OMAG_001655, partial [Candidatus Omnitrophus magneticus]
NKFKKGRTKKYNGKKRNKNKKIEEISLSLNPIAETAAFILFIYP